MNSAIERLLKLRVADVMSKKVVSVSTRDTMTLAAQTLVKHAISGVPVLDDQRGCAGMLSAIDFVKQQAGNRASRAVEESRVDARSAFEKVNACGDDPVSDHMTATVHSITANQTLLDAARMMCAHHIHRLPVLDERGRTAGMVTALDIVAALVNAIAE